MMVVGIAATGFVAGWIAGQSGLTNHVASSLIATTTVLVGGGGLIWSILRFEDINSWIGLVLLIFAISIFSGVQIGVNVQRQITANDRQIEFEVRNWQEDIELERRRKQVEKEFEWRENDMVRCSDLQHQVNKYRTNLLGLEPLPFEAYCK